MNIEELIADLLLDNDQVVIPSVGTIKAAYDCATIHPVQHLFQPPHKTFSFAAEEHTSDTTLEETLSSRSGLSQQSAKKNVDDFVNEIKTSLSEKGTYELREIGKFYYDIEKKLQFISRPEKNYLLTSFGLPEFISKPVLHPENVAGYSSQDQKKEKNKGKKRRFIWFRF